MLFQDTTMVKKRKACKENAMRSAVLASDQLQPAHNE